MFDGANVQVLPTYDAIHYLVRARRYERDAMHEPDATLSRLLREVEKRCRRNAQDCEARQHEACSPPPEPERLIA